MHLPCRLPPGVGTQSSLTARWTPPGGPDLLVAGGDGNFNLQLEAVSQAQAGAYTCHIHLQGQQLSATVTLAVITGQPQVGKDELPSQGSWDREGRPAGPRLGRHLMMLGQGAQVAEAALVASFLAPT